LPVPAAFVDGNRHHVDAINRARFDAQVTAGAFLGNDGVHLFGGTQDGVDRTSLNTFSATNALVFANDGNGWYGLFGTMFGIQGLWLYP